MTIQSRRIKFAKILFTVYSTPSTYLALLILAVVPRARRLTHLLAMRMERKAAAIGEMYSQITRRAVDITPQLKKLEGLPPLRQKEILAQRSALIADLEFCRARHSRLKVPVSVRALSSVTQHLHETFERRLREYDSFQKLAQRVDSETYYLDLLLWLVLPSDFGEQALGDLNEEYLIRSETLGPSQAQAWYRRQVRDSVKACFWRKLERIAVIGTIVDLLMKLIRSLGK